MISFGRCLGKGSRGRNPVSDVTVTGGMDMVFFVGGVLLIFESSSDLCCWLSTGSYCSTTSASTTTV